MTRTTHKTNFLLGIRITPFTDKPVFNMDNWKVYDAGKLPVENPSRNLNFQVERNEEEKIVVRIFISVKNEICHAKYYHSSHADAELSYYIAMAVVMRFANKYPLASVFKIKHLA